ncbi:MAG: glycosyltransferase family 39 protein [Candidatus Omnitrophica bacterium]|nr:glycosyltransferase family 39 protein [Candidatus Omnitrophota bacterium]
MNFPKKHFLSNTLDCPRPEKLLWIIITCGAVLYLRQYLVNRPLWLDEAALSKNIIALSVRDFLSQPLPYYQQASPIGFLIIEKLSVFLFGTSEYALRLFPLLCGLLSLGTFSSVARNYLKKEFSLLALFAFAITPALVYYSSEVKPYSCDVFITLLSLTIIPRSLSKELGWSKTFLIGLGGACLLWFSFPALFVLSGIAATLFIDALVRKDHNKILKICVTSCFWIISYSFLYFITLQNIAHHKGTESYWQDGYVSFSDIKNWIAVFSNILSYPVGLPKPLLAVGALLFVAGGVSFFKEDKKKFFFLIMPIALTFLASGFHVYSCKDRLALFLVPLFLLLILNGLKTLSLWKGRLGRIAAMALICILFSASLESSGKNFINPKQIENIKPILSYIRGHRQANDIICMSNLTKVAFQYYAPSFSLSHLEWKSYINTGLDQEITKNSLNNLPKKKRVWITFSHTNSKNNQGIDKFCINYLIGAGGKLLDQTFSTGASGYLLDLSNIQNASDNR